jgi:hypothetical protein
MTTFGSEASFPFGVAGETALTFAMGEFDGSLGIDVAIAMGSDIVIMAGDNAGSFSQGMKLGSGATHLVVADFDIDGDDDVAAFAQGSNRVFVRRQNSDADPSTFEAEQELSLTFNGVRAAASGLFDGAFVPDLIVQDGTRSQVFTANLGTPGTFSAGGTLGGANHALALVMQLDATNRDDVVFVDTGSIAPTVRVQLNTGSTFGPLVTIGPTVGNGVGAGQFAASPAPDLVVAEPQGGRLYANSGSGQFQAVAAPLPAFTEGTVQVADANNDGLVDLLTPTRLILQCAATTPGGAGTFTQVESITAMPPALLVDVNKDTKLDLVRVDGDQLKVRLQ